MDTQRTINQLRNIADGLEAADIPGIGITLHDVKVYNNNCRHVRQKIWVDRVNAKRADAFIITYADRDIYGYVTVDKIRVPVLRVEHVRFGFLDATWNHIARAARDFDFPPCVCKPLFAAMNKSRREYFREQKDEYTTALAAVAELEDL